MRYERWGTCSTFDCTRGYFVACVFHPPAGSAPRNVTTTTTDPSAERRSPSRKWNVARSVNFRDEPFDILRITCDPSRSPTAGACHGAQLRKREGVGSTPFLPARTRTVAGGGGGGGGEGKEKTHTAELLELRPLDKNRLRNTDGFYFTRVTPNDRPPGPSGSSLRLTVAAVARGFPRAEQRSIGRAVVRRRFGDTHGIPVLLFYHLNALLLSAYVYTLCPTTYA